MTDNDQQKLIDFVRNPKTIVKAAEGSMQKRQELMDKVRYMQSNHARCLACDDYITPLDSIDGIHPDCLYVEGD